LIVFLYLARFSDSTYAIDWRFAFYEIAILQVCSGGLRRVWRHQRGNQHRYIEKEQTTQRPKEKVHKDNQRSTKHTHKTKDRVTWTPLKAGCDLTCSGRVSSSCSTSGTRRVELDTNSVISHEWGQDREVLTTNGTYPWSFPTQIFHSGQPSQGGDRTPSEVMIST
jgi:hypothetical protein